MDVWPVAGTICADERELAHFSITLTWFCAVIARLPANAVGESRATTRVAPTALSLGLDAGVLDHPGCADELILDKCAELSWRRAKHLEADLADLCLDLRIFDDLSGLEIEPRNDLAGDAGRREQSGPGFDLEILQAGFVERRQIGKQRAAPQPRDAERPH